MRAASRPQEWWHDFFDDLFADIVLKREDQADNLKTIHFLEQVLELSKGALIFDQCCGMGDMSRLFNNHHYATIGIDIIPAYIKGAKQRRASESLAHFEVADARDYVTSEPCDAAINWYTSFGYSEDDQDNIKMLECAYKSLKPGAKFALDITNITASYRKGEGLSYYEQETEQGLVKIERRYFFDLAKGMRGSVWRYEMPDGDVFEKTGRSRLYAPRELQNLLEKAGFCDVTFYGDLEGGPLRLDSERCIAIARKKAV